MIPNILHNNGGIQMLVRAKMFIAFSLIAMAVAVVSLPAISLAATSPTVTVLDPLSNGLNTRLRADQEPLLLVRWRREK